MVLRRFVGRWGSSGNGGGGHGGVSCDIVEVVEGEDPCGEEAEGLESLPVGYAERSGDALGGEVEEGLCGGGWLGEEGFGGGLEPEHVVEAAVGVEGSVEELGDEGVGFMAWGLVQDELALGVEALEGVVPSGGAVFPEGLGDLEGFVFLGEVTGDAQEVAAFGAGGQGLGEEFALEDADGFDDGVQGVGGDGVAEVSVGVGEAEVFERLVEGVADEGVGPAAAGLLGAFLFTEALAEGGAGLFDLLGGGVGLEVDLGTGAAVTVSAGFVVEGSGPGLADGREDLAGDLSERGAVDNQGWSLLLEEAERSFGMGLGIGHQMPPVSII